MSEEMIQNLMYSLEIMWKGMVGIFAVIIVIAIIVFILSKLDNLPGKKKEEQS